MSLTEIDDVTYDLIRTQEVARYINSGLDLESARHMADEIMSAVYIRRTTAIQCDVQKDFDDQRQGDWTR